MVRTNEFPGPELAAEIQQQKIAAAGPGADQEQRHEGRWSAWRRDVTQKR
jgi:hypothetical protein